MTEDELEEDTILTFGLGLSNGERLKDAALFDASGQFLQVAEVVADVAHRARRDARDFKGQCFCHVFASLEYFIDSPNNTRLRLIGGF